MSSNTNRFSGPDSAALYLEKQAPQIILKNGVLEFRHRSAPPITVVGKKVLKTKRHGTFHITVALGWAIIDNVGPHHKRVTAHLLDFDGVAMGNGMMTDLSPGMLQ